MARHFMTYFGSITLTAENPQTLAILQAGADVRAAITGVELMPMGATAQAASIQFDFATVTDDGTNKTLDASNLRKDLPAASEANNMTVRKYAGVGEPAGPVVVAQCTLHQMAQRQWQPLTFRRELILVGGQRLAFRKITAIASILVNFQIHVEE